MARNPKKFFGNWKMNGSFSFIDKYFAEFLSIVNTGATDTICIMPPACYIDYAKEKSNNEIMIGAQDMSMTGEDNGSFTGQIGTSMYEDCGAEYVLIGQAECREYLGLTNEYLNRRILNAFRNGLNVVYCVGDNLDEHDGDGGLSIIREQLTDGLANILGFTTEAIERLVIAYEPVWAIGTGKTCSAKDAENYCVLIRQILEEISSYELASGISIVYGGSVKPSNVEELVSQANIDGVLAGGASLRPVDFATIINLGAQY